MLTMKNPLAILCVCLAFATSPAWAQSYKITGVYPANTTPTATQGVLPLNPNTTDCQSQTWYGPEVFLYPPDDFGRENLGFIAQGGHNADTSCGMLHPVDSFYSAERDTASGVWTTPPTGACPTVRGEYVRCGSDPASGENGPIGGPSIVRIKISDGPPKPTYKYFMAYNGGNSDFVTDGKIYWAVSDDARTWMHYNWNPPNGENDTPIIYPYYHDCEGSAALPDGVQAVSLLFEPNDTVGGINPNGTFYIFFNYINHGAFYGGLAYRFGYTPPQPLRFGS